MKSNRLDTKKEPKDGEIAKLKKRIKRLMRDNDRLISDVKQLRVQVNKQQEYINKHVKNVSLEDLMKIDKKTDKHANNSCNECGSNDILINKLPFGTINHCRECANVRVIKES